MPDHLGVRGTSAYAAIITGNPDRVAHIANHFDSGREIATRRGFICYEAKLEKNTVLIVSTGIGAPSTAIVVEELVDLGIPCIIRLGTCGPLQSGIEVGDIIVPTGCIREEGTSAQYISPSFPAVPDYRLLYQLVQSIQAKDIRYHIGITHCKDAYYSEHPSKQVDPSLTGQSWNQWRKAGALATEMESSILFILGSLRSILTGALFITVGKVTPPDIYQSSLSVAVSCIKETLVVLSNQNLLERRSTEIDTTSFLD